MVDGDGLGIAGVDEVGRGCLFGPVFAAGAAAALFSSKTAETEAAPKVVNTPSGLQYWEIREGNGDCPTKGDIVKALAQPRFVSSSTHDGARNLFRNLKILRWMSSSGALHWNAARHRA